ncbi:MAG: glycosyltransferase family 4 protein [Deltaproteobacteria bacterium]|nr:glycosyltransferase family 4 protein [Deltaproteobacteria bacterium]
MNLNFGLYWDAYGLDAPNSGIFVHAHSIAKELDSLGYAPRLVGLKSALCSFPRLQGLHPLAHPLTKWWTRNKFLWPESVARRIESDSAGSYANVVLHGLSNFNIPIRPRNGWRLVLTVHDLIPIIAPHDVSTSLNLQMKFLLPRAMRAADCIVCVSRWTKETIIDFMPTLESKLVVIPNGVASFSPSVKTHSESGNRIRLLFVSRFERYKCHETLVTLLKSSNLALELDVITDLKGQRFWQSRAIDMIQNGRLRVHCGVYGDELRRFYENADVYVSPSRLEGYCLPAIEALSAATPVVYVGGSGIDEVAGSSVSYRVQNPLKIADWEDAICLAKSDSERSDYSIRVNEYLKTLPSWKDAAVELLTLYNKLV